MKIKRFKNENGAVVVIVALSIIALMMVTALAIDVGSLYEERRFLQTVADAAALAGAQELPDDDVNPAINEATNYALKCGLDIDDDIEVEVSSTLAPGVNDTVTVNVINPNAPLYFARVIGMSETQVVASATARVASPKEYVGVVPWGIPEEDYVPGEEYVLKWGSGPEGGVHNGNFQPLGIDGTGGHEYNHDITYGCDTPLEAGDFVFTETGGMTGPTQQAVEDRIYLQHNTLLDSFIELVESTETGYELVTPDSQFIIVPIIPELVGSGHHQVEILAFAPFIITGVHDMQDPIFGQGFKVAGTFLDEALIKSKVSDIIPVEPGGIKVIILIE